MRRPLRGRTAVMNAATSRSFYFTVNCIEAIKMGLETVKRRRSSLRNSCLKWDMSEFPLKWSSTLERFFFLILIMLLDCYILGTSFASERCKLPGLGVRPSQVLHEEALVRIASRHLWEFCFQCVNAHRGVGLLVCAKETVSCPRDFKS